MINSSFEDNLEIKQTKSFRVNEPIISCLSKAKKTKIGLRLMWEMERQGDDVVVKKFYAYGSERLFQGNWVIFKVY